MDRRFKFILLIGLFLGVFSIDISIGKFFLFLFAIPIVIKILIIKNRYNNLIPIFILGIILGGILSFLYNEISLNDYLEEKEYIIEGTISQVNFKKSNLLLVLSNKKKIICYNDNISKFSEGDFLSFSGSIKKYSVKRNPGGIDYRRMYLSKNIIGYSNLKEDNIFDHIKKKNKYYYFRNKIRNYLIDILNENIKSDYFGYASSIFLGTKEFISEKDYSIIKIMGFSHILAVSGLHIGIIYLILDNIMKVIYVPWKIRKIIELFIMSIFSLICFSFYSVMRALHLIYTVIIGDLLNLKTDFTETTSLFGLIMIFYNPYVIYNLSFNLSMMAVFAIFYLSNHISDKFDIFKVYIAISIMIFPVLIIYFGEVSIIGLLIAPFFATFAEILILCNFFSVFLFVFTKINILFYLDNFFLKVFSLILKTGENFDLNLLSINFHNLYFYIFYYLIIFLFPIIEKKNWKKIASSIIIFFLIFGIYKFKERNYIDIYFFDVGMGDSTLIKNSNFNILIDSGKEKNAYNILRSLKFLDVKKIDYFIISHFHEDHYGGVFTLIDENKINKIICTDNTYNLLLEEIENRNIIIDNDIFILINKDCQIDLHENSNLKFYFSSKFYCDNENNNSIINIFNYKNFTLFLTADIEREREREFLKKFKDKDFREVGDNRILKVAHHGSNSSSSPEFIEAFHPYFSVISVGKNNYGLPDKEVKNRLINFNSKVVTTYDKGCVKIKLAKKI